MAGFKFRRQHGIGRYIVDFYCPELKLAIEVDGDIHAIAENIEKDVSRQEYIESLGIQVKRYKNDDIKHNLDSVLKDLYNTIQTRKENFP